MAKAKVYWMDDRSNSLLTSLAYKGAALFEQAGLNECFDKGDRVAVKCHMGVWGTTHYLRPFLIRVICDKIKEYGGQPFVTDTTTVNFTPFDSRVLAQDYLFTAAAHGFTQESMGCPILIADGEAGLDDVKIEVPNPIFTKYAYGARGIVNADAMIVVSHFKGHPMGVFGGAIKNIGIGCQSKRGKMMVHLTTHPDYGLASELFVFSGEACGGLQGCPWGPEVAKTCETNCPTGAVKVLEDHMEWDRSLCIGCFGHVLFPLACGVWSIPDEFLKMMPITMGETASAIVNYMGKDRVGYINFAIDVSPWCDCVDWADRAILPNLGVFASRDMVAVDLAVLDMTMKKLGIEGSAAEELCAMEEEKEKFTICGGLLGNIPQWIQCNVVRELGMGSTDYELIEGDPYMDYRKCWFPRNSPEKPLGQYLKKAWDGVEVTPSEGFEYLPKLRISYEELSKRPSKEE